MDVYGQASAVSGGVVESPSCDVNLFLSCNNLVSKDVLSASDPFVTVEMLDNRTKRWVKVGTTKVSKNNNNPRWDEAIRVKYRFEEEQHLKLKIYDYDNLTNHDLVGTVDSTLGNIIGTRGQCKTFKIKKKHGLRSDRGTCTIRAEKLNSADAGLLVLHLRAHKLDSKDLMGFGRSDPFFTIERKLEGGDVVLVHKSEYISNNNNPTWKPLTIDMAKLCNNDSSKKLLFRVWDHDSDGSQDLIGEAFISVSELLNASGKPSVRFDVKHPPTKRKYKKSTYVNSGTLEVVKAFIKKSALGKMLDYIAGGLQINLIVGVDYTASNGDPNHPSSLHYRQHYPQQMATNTVIMNQYQQAIRGVGGILLEYDADKMIPTFGFGAKLNGAHEAVHCFALNGNAHQPEVHGIEGIMQAYDASFSFARLSGPTYFAPLINAAQTLARVTEQSQHSQKYTILLILTDGEVNDMRETIDSIVAASSLPLSIVIVGVGNSNFGKMVTLDADKQGLRSSNGRPAARDVVQFVPYNECGNDPTELARHTLMEIPDQIVKYFESYNIKPNPPIPPQHIMDNTPSPQLTGAVQPPMPPPPQPQQQQYGAVQQVHATQPVQATPAYGQAQSVYGQPQMQGYPQQPYVQPGMAQAHPVAAPAQPVMVHTVATPMDQGYIQQTQPTPQQVSMAERGRTLVHQAYQM